MVGKIGVSDFGAVAAAVTGTQVLGGQMQATGAITNLFSNAVLPPGIESASVLAKIQQSVSNTNFASNLAIGIGELEKRAALMAEHSLSVMGVDSAGAASMLGVDTALPKV